MVSSVFDTRVRPRTRAFQGPSHDRPVNHYLASWNGVQGSLVDEGLGFGRGDGLEATVYKRTMAQNTFPELDDDLLSKLELSLSG